MGILCLFYRNKLAALTSNELPEALALRVERHLQQCPDCLSEWAAQQRMAAALRGAAPTPAMPSPQLWDRLETAIESEAAGSVPVRPPFRPLGPLGGLALAGAAAAAILVARPTLLPPSPRSVAAPAPVVPVAVMPPSAAPQPHTRPTQRVASAVELGQRAAGLDRAPSPISDPFALRSHRTERFQAPESPSERLIHTVRSARPLTSARRAFPGTETAMERDLPPRAKNNAVALVEVGMHRVVEESQTEELNRLVSEAERKELGTQATAADATVNAQHTQGSLFQ